MKHQSIQAVNSSAAPAAVGPYSHAVCFGDLVYTSGQIPLNPKTGELVSPYISEQTHQTIDYLQSVLKEAGSSLDSIIKITCFLTDLSHFPLVNTIFEERFSSPYPARSCLEVSALPKNSLVEIEAVAAVTSD